MASSTSLVPITSKSRITLTSLPQEIIKLVALQLDQKSAISLSVVARSLHTPSEYRVWRDIDVFLNPHHGERVLVQPHERSSSGAHVDWAIEMAKDAEQRHRAALKGRVRTLLVGLGERRMGMVEKVSVIPREGALLGIMQLLDTVSPTLKRLEVLPQFEHVFDNHWASENDQTLDVRMLSETITFPFLTHLHIDAGAIRFNDYLLLLLSRAPNLISLDADLSGEAEVPDWEEGSMAPLFPNKIGETKLQRVRLVFGDEDVERDDNYPAGVVLMGSPLLQQACLQDNSNDQDLEHIIAPAIKGSRCLSELDWSITLNDFTHCYSGTDAGLVSLQRLVLGSGWSSAFDPILHLRESIFEDRPCGTARPTGIIRSFTHGNEEVLHAHLLLRYMERADVPSPFPPHRSNSPDNYIEYAAADGSQRQRRFDRHYEGYQDFTDYKGVKVPMWVLQKMRRAEGVEYGGWEGRGIEVGDKGWKVLQDWKAGYDKEKAAEGAK